MVQVLKSAQDFELFGGTALAPSGRAPKIQKPKRFWADAPFSTPQLPFLGLKSPCYLLPRPLVWGVLLVLLAVAGCSTPTSTSHSFAEGTLRAHELIRRYGVAPRGECTTYLTTLLHSVGGSDAGGLEVVVLTTRESLALFPGGNQVLISTGLLQRLTSEAEAAFLLTHEAGHVILQHQVTLSTQGGEITEAKIAQMRRTMELEADTFALEKIHQAGYHPNAAVTALHAVYRDSGTVYAADLGHPPLPERVQNLMKAAKSLPDQAIGIQDRREFQHCRVSLRR